jgi:cytochrome c oxidase subunit 2
MWNFPSIPEQASTHARHADSLFFALIGLTLFFVVVIAAFLLYFSVKYRRGSKADRSHPVSGNIKLEIVWTLIPLVLALGVFIWGTKLYFDLFRFPPGAFEINVVAKQWLWSFKQPDGRQEINELHVPLGRPVKLTMTSEDVIHSFFVPAFRIKQDVLPGRDTSLWFEATKPGEFQLFCAEYCGANHAYMVGRVIVMEQEDYAQWLRTGSVQPPEESAAAVGEKLFGQLGCSACHQASGKGIGPALAGLFGSTVTLQSGETITADEAYVRESVLKPTTKIVRGYTPAMPSFQGQINDAQLAQIIAYIRTLGPAP